MKQNNFFLVLHFREKALEIQDLFFLPLSYFSLQDVQELSDGAATSGIEPSDSEEEDKFFEKKISKETIHFDLKERRVV